MPFIPNKEQWKLINNAEDTLLQYKYYLHHSRRFPGQLGSPKFDGMPKSPSHGNSIEDDIVEHVDDPNRAYCQYCQAIVNDIGAYENKMYAEIIKMLYFGWHTPMDVRKRFHLTRNPYYDNLKRAKLVFGASCDMKIISYLRRKAKRYRG